MPEERRKRNTWAVLLTQVERLTELLSGYPDYQQGRNGWAGDLTRPPSIWTLSVAIMVRGSAVFVRRGHTPSGSSDSSGTSEEVVMDEKLLRQIIGNLLSNAIKYSPTG